MKKRQVNSFLVIIVSIAVAIFITQILEALGYFAFSRDLVEEISALNGDAAKEAYSGMLDRMSFWGKISIIIAWLLGVMSGGFVSSLMSATNKVFHAKMVGYIYLFFTIMTLLNIPHPWWMWLSVFLIIPASFMGSSFIPAKAKDPDEPEIIEPTGEGF